MELHGGIASETNRPGRKWHSRGHGIGGPEAGPAVMNVSGKFRAKVCKSCIYAVSEQGRNAVRPVRSRLSQEGWRATASPRLGERAQQKNRRRRDRNSYRAH
jgi:hypothetical protein